MPKRKQIVITNTTPIIALSLIGQLNLLAKLYKEVMMPMAVYNEILAGGNRAGANEVQDITWLFPVTLSDPSRADLLADLDRGEAETIALAQETKATLVIIDERLARLHAKRLGLTVTGTLGILLKAKEQGLVTEIRPFITQLQQGGIRLDKSLITKVLKLADE